MADTETEELSRRFSIAQAMLDRVIHTTDNLDEKVGRIFTSVSFITVGASILFTSFVSNNLLFRLGGVDFVPLVFIAFLVSVATATGYMLQAMGPRLRLNPFSSGSGENRSLGPSPTAYADKIALMKEDEWTAYLRKTPLGTIYDASYAETLQEIYVLSKKVNRKVGEMRKAQRAFILSIVLLVLMLLLAVSSYF